jgi:hypothetical protein
MTSLVPCSSGPDDNPLADTACFGFLSGEKWVRNHEWTERAMSNPIKDPDDWTTGEEPMTAAQESYLRTLAAEAGEEVEGGLTKAEASKRIDELRQKTGKAEATR